MPELPEVETVVRQLRPFLTGRTIKSLEILDKKLETNENNKLSGKKIVSVTRLGKQICFKVSAKSGDKDILWLVIHLRMTGRLITDSHCNKQNPKHLRARLLLDKGCLFFYDLRRFGSLQILNSLEKVQPAGIDPLSSKFTIRKLKELVAGTKQEIKPWLLRQDRLTGLGNIYASEILHAAGITPGKLSCALTPCEIRNLHHYIQQVLKLAIEHCGTTFSDFQDAQGQTGSFQNLLAVYGKEGLPCPGCSRPIQRIVQQQRSTFFCPVCQK